MVRAVITKLCSTRKLLFICELYAICHYIVANRRSEMEREREVLFCLAACTPPSHSAHRRPTKKSAIGARQLHTPLESPHVLLA